MIFSAMGAAYGTAKSGTGIAAMAVMRPGNITTSNDSHQIPAKRGPASGFVVKANRKPLLPKLNNRQSKMLRDHYVWSSHIS